MGSPGPQGRSRIGRESTRLCAYGASPGPPIGDCALMVEIAGTSPAMTESAATSFAPVTSCRIFGWSAFAVETARPPLDVLIPPRRAHYGRKTAILEDGKVYLARLFGDFSRSKPIAYNCWWCLTFEAGSRKQIGRLPRKRKHAISVRCFLLYVVFLTHPARQGELHRKQSFKTRKTAPHW
jgi:hypothetical protein